MSAVKPPSPSVKARQTLRDTIAISAMQGILASSSSMRNDHRIVVRQAYAIAEEMINHRNSNM